MASLVVGGCSANQDRRDDEYFYQYHGTYYPVEDGLPYDADVNRYSHRERYYYVEKPAFWGADLAQQRDR